ncbi:MAG: response regulator [Candidatus Coatesbacteria bacterium]|nr:response regulator [Candidatus Coatesbacteria bacterium]
MHHPLLRSVWRLKFEHRIILLSVAIGFAFWSVYSIADAWTASEGSFWDHLVNPISIKDFHKRLFPAASMIAFGILLSRLWRMRRKALEETVHATEALKKSERRYRLLAENISDVIWVSDLNMERITFVSPSIKDLLGFTVEEAKAFTMEEILTKTAGARAEIAQVKELLNQEMYISPAIELELLKKDGSAVWTETRLTVLYSESAEPLELIFVTRDITERKETEQRLAQSERMEAIGRLAGGVAHDFNNILTTIIGNLDLLHSEGSLSDRSMKFADDAIGAANRATALTKQLLSFGRQTEAAPVAIDLNNVLTDLRSMLRRLIREDIAIEINLEEPIPAIKADIAKVEQVIVNLAVNSRDAMPEGGELIIETSSLRMKRRLRTSHGYLAPGSYVVLTVRDNGSGIPDDSIVHIFEPFFTTKQMGMGTGLGLSTVYRIVQQAGGSLDVESEIGNGSSFKIYLPAIEEEAVELKREELVAEEPESTKGHGESILVVEDEAAVMELIEHILSESGYRVRTALTGEDAIAIASELGAEADLLLTDLVMPEMQGEDLSQIIERNCPNIKTLFMSGYTDEVIRRGDDTEAASRFIGKPFTPSELLKKVRSTLDEDSSREP